jgi:hypothetical protein
MKINQYLVKRRSSRNESLLPGRVPDSFSDRPGPLSDYRFGIFAKHIERAALLGVALGATIVLTTGCSSTGTGFAARLISPVPTNQQVTNSQVENWYQSPRSPGFDPDLFGS